MNDTDLTINEVLQDPLICLMMRADGVSLKAMKTLLANAALAQRNHNAGSGPRGVISGLSDKKHFAGSQRETCANLACI